MTPATCGGSVQPAISSRRSSGGAGSASCAAGASVRAHAASGINRKTPGPTWSVLFPEFRKLVGDHERSGSVLAILSSARSSVFLSLRRALLLGGVPPLQFSGLPLTFGRGQPFLFRGFALTFGGSQPFSFRRRCALAFCCRFFLDAAPLGTLTLDECFRLESPALGFKPSPFFLARPFGRGCSFGFEPTSLLLASPLSRCFSFLAQAFRFAFARGRGLSLETASLRVLGTFGGELGFELAPLVLTGALGRRLCLRFCFLPFLFARTLRRRFGLRLESLALFLAGPLRCRLGRSGFRFETLAFFFARLLRGSLRRSLGFLALFLARARGGRGGLRLGLPSFLFPRPLSGCLGFRFETFALLFARLLRDNLCRGLGLLAFLFACARGCRSSFCLCSLPLLFASACRGRGRLSLGVGARAVGFSFLLIGLDLELLRALTLGCRRRLEPSVLFLHLPPFGLTLFLGRTALFLRGLNRQRHARDRAATANSPPVARPCSSTSTEARSDAIRTETTTKTPTPSRQVSLQPVPALRSFPRAPTRPGRPCRRPGRPPVPRAVRHGCVNWQPLPVSSVMHGR